MDEDTGLLYMRARYYDPEVGRFAAKDPIRVVGGKIGCHINRPDKMSVAVEFPLVDVDGTEVGLLRRIVETWEDG
jgi:RHS repeat-associated protein